MKGDCDFISGVSVGGVGCFVGCQAHYRLDIPGTDSSGSLVDCRADLFGGDSPAVGVSWNWTVRE